MLKLAASHHNNCVTACDADLPPGKRVTTANGLGVDTTKVVRNRTDRGSLSSEAFQLRVMSIAGCPARKYRLCQESLPPKRNESACVEILRMQ